MCKQKNQINQSIKIAIPQKKAKMDLTHPKYNQSNSTLMNRYTRNIFLKKKSLLSITLRQLNSMIAINWFKAISKPKIGSSKLKSILRLITMFNKSKPETKIVN